MSWFHNCWQGLYSWSLPPKWPAADLALLLTALPRPSLWLHFFPKYKYICCVGAILWVPGFWPPECKVWGQTAGIKIIKIYLASQNCAIFCARLCKVRACLFVELLFRVALLIQWEETKMQLYHKLVLWKCEILIVSASWHCFDPKFNPFFFFFFFFS